jgi:predicted amidohydrolase
MFAAIDENGDCDLLVFPEFYLASVANGILEEIHAYVRRQRVSVIVGGIEKVGRHCYDTAFLFDYDRRHKYRKTHVHWTEKFTPGTELPVFDTTLGKIGMLVCYDSTFIETSRVLALAGAEIIVIVAAVPAYFDVKISLIRIQANAAENQVFIVYVNKPMAEMCSGNSMIVNPKGRIVSCAGSVDAVVTGLLARDDLLQWREQEHIFPYRRPELYGAIAARPEGQNVRPKRKAKKSNKQEE